MPVRVMPAIGGIALMPGRDTNVESGINGSDFSEDGFVDGFLCSRSLSPYSLASRFFQVPIIQAKPHCTQYDVETLKQDVVMRADFRDVFL